MECKRFAMIEQGCYKKADSWVNKTIDRVLDVLLIRPTAAQIKGKSKKSQSGNDRRNQRRIVSLSPSPYDGTAPFPPDSSPTPQAVAVKTPFEQLQADLDIPDGLPLPDDELIEIEEWEILTGRSLDETDVEEVAGLVGWGLFKWQDLQYDQGKSYHYPPRAPPGLHFLAKRKTSKSLHRRLKKKRAGIHLHLRRHRFTQLINMVFPDTLPPGTSPSPS